MTKRKLNKELHIRDIWFNQKGSAKRRNLGGVQYTREQLTEWCLAQPLYHQLHDAWVQSNFLRELAPSIDRKDDYKPYSLDNIQIMTAKENLSKAFKDRFDGVNTKMSTSVHRMDEAGVILETYPSCNAAGRAMGATNGAMVSAVCSGKREHAHGFRWSYNKGI